MGWVENRARLPFRLADLPAVPQPGRVLLASPDAFDVRYAINPHMRDERGELRRVEATRADAQWRTLRDALEALGLEVEVLPAVPDLCDLVFCANPALPLPPHKGRLRALRSRMAAPERRAEVELVGRALAGLGYELLDLPAELGPLEGTGDGVWHPGRALLWAGVGPRSSEAAWRAAAELAGIEAIRLELVDPDFYHLDTALAPIDERTCLWFPPALAPAGQELVRALFADPIEVDEAEARRLFACNAWSPDGEHVLIQAGCERASSALRERGHTVLELETGEFLKSGGSVFCMKLALW